MAQSEAKTSSLAREYESIYVLRPDVERESAEKISTRLQEVIQREGGTLTLVENWGRRQLAYTVSKCKRGVYVYLRYVGVGGLVSELERNLRMLDDVIKYQSVKLRDDVDVASLTIDPELVRFEPVQPPEDDEPEESYARSLGLEEPTREPAPTSERAGAEAQSGRAETSAATEEAKSSDADSAPAADGAGADSAAEAAGADSAADQKESDDGSQEDAS
jgi:small subunit ribosomal protein S6